MTFRHHVHRQNVLRRAVSLLLERYGAPISTPDAPPELIG